MKEIGYGREVIIELIGCTFILISNKPNNIDFYTMFIGLALAILGIVLFVKKVKLYNKLKQENDKSSK